MPFVAQVSHEIIFDDRDIIAVREGDQLVAAFTTQAGSGWILEFGMV